MRALSTFAKKTGCHSLSLRRPVQRDFDPGGCDGDEIGTAVAVDIGNLESSWRNAYSKCVGHLKGPGFFVEKHIEIIASVIHQHDVGPAVGVYIYCGYLVSLVARVEDEVPGKSPWPSPNKTRDVVGMVNKLPKRKSEMATSR